MGLDLIVEGCPKPGHEDEWRSILKRSFADKQVSESEIARFREICIPAYERIGAPRVGHDAAANEWILRARKPQTSEEAARILKEFDGYYVVRLVDCDGVPKYSNAGSYEGADDTSFRGAFLNDCQDVLSKDLLDDAWNHKFPEEAVSYGKALLTAANAAERGREAPKTKGGFLSRLGFAKREATTSLGLGKSEATVLLSEQLEIVRAAGRWFIFWGERGHAIRAWF